MMVKKSMREKQKMPAPIETLGTACLAHQDDTAGLLEGRFLELPYLKTVY